MTATVAPAVSTQAPAGAATVLYQPILDVARGVPAGYQAHCVTAAASLLDRIGAGAHGDDTPAGGYPHDLAATMSTALATLPTLPANTFLALPVPVALAAHPAVRAALLGPSAPRTLERVVLDIVGVAGEDTSELEAAAATYRTAGALLSVGGSGAAQPEITSIVRLNPAIIRLGRDWVRGIDTSVHKRETVETIGRLAGQLDAWILCEGVATAAELRTLASLHVPLAQGPFVGEPQPFWPDIDLGARTALPKDASAAPTAMSTGSDGVLRELLQPVYTATDAAAAASVLPETSGFDVVVVVDEHHRPVSLLDCGADARWQVFDVLPVNVDTTVSDVVSRAMARPRSTRFTPLACTDERGRLLGILRVERLMTHLARP